MEALNAEWSKVSQDLYNASQQEAQSSGGQEEASSESTKNSDNNAENVENVDYEVVDDEKDK